MQKVYDIAVIGAGVSGASIARRLSAYDVSVVVLEKCADVSFGVSKANSGIIHAGFHHKTDTLKARLEIKGNLMFEQLHNELGFPFERVGILVVAFSREQMETVKRLYDQGVANGVPRLEVVGAERVRQMEPKLSDDVEGALYAPTGGIIEPYRYVFALMESACKNGVDLICDFEVVSAEYAAGAYEITSKDGNKVRAQRVVNASGLYADRVSRIFKAEEFEIVPRKGEEYLLQRGAPAYPNHVIFPVPAKDTKGMLVIPTVEGTMMVGPTAEEIEDREDVSTTADNLQRVFEMATRMVPSVSKRDIITSFVGLRPALKNGDFYIELSTKAKHFVQVAGIQSPGLTASPAIGEYVKDLLKSDGMVLTEKALFDPHVERSLQVRKMTVQQVDEAVKKDPAYGNIVCRCESVSEAQILEAIRKGHTTLDGIKFYTRAQMGRCQGGFCTYRILQIIQRETGMSVEEITKRGGQSRLITGRLGQQDAG